MTGLTIVLFIVGFLGAQRIHPILLPVFLTIAVYPFYFSFVSLGKLKEAVAIVLLWALITSILVVLTVFWVGEDAGKYIIRGLEYRKEMFEWIMTGKGAEGDINLFLVPKIIELTIFSLASFLTIGFGGLLLGSILLNYMNYYVGCLLLYAREEYFLHALILSWPIYAILRVVGYVFLGTALSRLFYTLIVDKKLRFKEVRSLVLWAIVFIVLDFILKATIANAYYQPLLKLILRI